MYIGSFIYISTIVCVMPFDVSKCLHLHQSLDFMSVVYCILYNLIVEVLLHLCQFFLFILALYHILCYLTVKECDTYVSACTLH